MISTMDNIARCRTFITQGGAIIVVLMLLLLLVHAGDASAGLERKLISIWPKTSVRVYNNLGRNINLYLHCKSRDDDLGTHLLKNGDVFVMRFRPSYWKKTVFTCDMQWNNNVNGTFDLYDDDRDKDRCSQCVWRVRKDGVRGYVADDRVEVEYVWFRWLPNPTPTSPYQ